MERKTPHNQERATAEYELAFYVPNLLTGGAEQVTVTIANGLAQRGHDIDLVVSNPRGKLQAEVADDVSIVALGESRPPFIGIGAHVPALASYLRRQQPAAIFAQMTHANLVCLLAGQLSRADTRIFLTEHSPFAMSENPPLRSRAYLSLTARLLPYADHHIAVSQGVADSIVQKTSVTADQVSVLHNPVDVEAVRSRAREPVNNEWLSDDSLDVMLSVGRLEAQKDLKTWLRAFSRVHERRPQTRAIIAGKGSQREGLAAFAAKLGVDDAVSIPGYVDNPYGYMQRADVFLLSSRYEGLPTVLIEALACGCPIVATDCLAGPREVLADGTYGQLVPVGDAPKMADAVVETLDRPPRAEKLQARSDDFAPGVVLEEYERFLDRHVAHASDTAAEQIP
ncbi:glycosyltransferase [Halovenus marina]|uniref:glycosyltransferase n=1 Tax=Halovenus marina TaxID=3396621 RepID=UPI003F5688E2